jgi:hypothetical protein
MASMWVLAVPAPWFVPMAAMVAGGFCMSLVNAPIQALMMLRVPRHLRPQAMASFGVFNCIGAPIGLILAGVALAHYDARAVLAVVLSMQTVAIATIVVSAIAERSSLRAAAAIV